MTIFPSFLFPADAVNAAGPRRDEDRLVGAADDGGGLVERDVAALGAPTLESDQAAVLRLFGQPVAPAATFHTIEAVAVMLGVSARTVRRRVRDGAIRKAPLGGRLVRIPDSEIERLLTTDVAAWKISESSNDKVLA